MDDDLLTCPTCGLEVAAGTKACPIDGAPLDAKLDRRSPGLLADTHVGEYVVKGVVGTGGMGVVYEGLQPLIGKRVAIKVLKREVAGVPHEAARLLTEARLVNAIGHRGIIDIFSFGKLADGRQYLVMEFLVGDSLFDHIDKAAPMRVDETVQILDEILAALSAAHGAGVIHRDLKPSNVFLVAQPDGSRYVKLLDFGLAKQAPLKFGDARQTEVSRVLGTPEFMAPEQARGQPVGPRTDLYALGCLAFEMLTGRLPFDAATGWEVINLHLNTSAPRPSSVVEDVPHEMDELVLNLLAKDPAERPASAEAVRAELKRIRKALQLSSTRLANNPWAADKTQLDVPPKPAVAITIPSLEPAVTLDGLTGTTLPSLDPAGQTQEFTDELRTAPAPNRSVAMLIMLGAAAGALMAGLYLWVSHTPAPAASELPGIDAKAPIGAARVALVSRIEDLRNQPGVPAKAEALLTEIRDQAMAAKDVKQLREVERLVMEWEHNHLPPK